MLMDVTIKGTVLDLKYHQMWHFVFFRHVVNPLIARMLFAHMGKFSQITGD